MLLDPFHQINDGLVTISPQQASRFAKEVADDFNPLHDADNNRFCVPGDLLFSLTLAQNGLAQKMVFNYTGMVGEGVQLKFPQQETGEYEITDTEENAYLNIDASGDVSHNAALIEAFTKGYVAFSGHSFPHILVPLMQEKQMMINPARPMVIYQNMSFQLDTLDFSNPSLTLDHSELEIEGKRGKVRFIFNVLDESGNQVGKGCKSMVLSGLRAYDEEKMQALIETYEATKSAYKNA